MQIIRNNFQNIKNNNFSIAIGNFDGIHKGHKFLIKELLGLKSSNNDKVGIIFFSNKVEKFIPPKKGKSHILRIIREVLSFQPTGKKTDLSEGLRYFNSVIKKRSICFILSDFITPEFEKSLKIANRKHDLVGIRIYDKRENTLPNVGLMPIEDAESEEIIFLDTSDKQVRIDFKNNSVKKIQKLKKIFFASGVDLIDIETGVDYVKPLINFFKNRGGKK